MRYAVGFLGGAPGANRTHDPQLRRLLLYPTELRARVEIRKESRLDALILAPRFYRRSARKRGLVGARGFEPPTSCSQSRRATGLRYAPRWNQPLHSALLPSKWQGISRKYQLAIALRLFIRILYDDAVFQWCYL
jgi:hypothetical protein